MKYLGLAAVLALLCAASAAAQDRVSYRGFVEGRSVFYGPSATDAVWLDGHARIEPAWRPADWLTLASSFDVRAGNQDQVAHEWRIDVRDRTLRRPALSLRQMDATIHKGIITADLGKQFIRWGKADILNPTDRFAPRDFLEVTDADYLAVTGARVQIAHGSQTIDLVAVPFFTPSRIPLLNRRWAVLPSAQAAVLSQLRTDFPARAQYGARWGVIRSGYELSASYFDGFNHLPEFGSTKFYAPLKMAGADAAASLTWFTLKGEIASLRTTSAQADDVVQYVIQAERQVGELNLVGGYAGEIVTASRSRFNFSPDRGLTKALLGRATYTIDTNSNASVELAVRQNGAGFWLKGEYSHAIEQHWRVTINATGIGGKDGDFFGQYRHNSHAAAALRYSF